MKHREYNVKADRLAKVLGSRVTNEAYISLEEGGGGGITSFSDRLFLLLMELFIRFSLSSAYFISLD